MSGATWKRTRIQHGTYLGRLQFFVGLRAIVGRVAESIGDVSEGGPFGFQVSEGAARFPLAHGFDGLLEDVLHVISAAGADAGFARVFRHDFHGRHVCTMGNRSMVNLRVGSLEEEGTNEELTWWKRRAPTPIGL